MTQREKILAAIVALMMLCIATLFVVQRVSSLFDRRHTQITQLDRDLARQKRIINAGMRAQKRFEELLSRSLPGDRTLARSLYENWLLKQAVGVGLTGVTVTPVAVRPFQDIYFEHTFIVQGEGNLQQLVEFLYEFTRRGLLHRITNLTAKPIGESKQLKLTITVDAISLNKAPNEEKLPDVPPPQFAHGDLEQYHNVIISRNVFSPANQPPSLSITGTRTAYVGRPFNFRIPARDPDGDNQFTFVLTGEAPEGLRLDPRTGEISWTPQQLGEYEVSVQVADSGLPSKTADGVIKINVVEPPEEPAPRLTFDPARYTFLTGITGINDQREVWITLRTEGRVLRLKEGDRIDVGSVKGVVRAIADKKAEIATDDGQVLEVSLGKSLRAAEGTPLGGL